MTPALAGRRSLLTAALGFALLDTRGKPTPPEVQTVRTWLDNWRGVGDIRGGAVAVAVEGGGKEVLMAWFLRRSFRLGPLRLWFVVALLVALAAVVEAVR